MTIIAALLLFGVIVLIHDLVILYLQRKMELQYMNLHLVWDQNYLELKEMEQYTP